MKIKNLLILVLVLVGAGFEGGLFAFDRVMAKVKGPFTVGVGVYGLSQLLDCERVIREKEDVRELTDVEQQTVRMAHSLMYDVKSAADVHNLVPVAGFAEHVDHITDTTTRSFTRNGCALLVDRRKLSPVVNAIRDGRTGAISALVAQGADLDNPAYGKETPLLVAATKIQDPEVVRELLTLGAKKAIAVEPVALRYADHLASTAAVLPGLYSETQAGLGCARLGAVAQELLK